MYRLVKKYARGRKGIAADVLDTETQEMYRVPYDDVVKLASHGYTDNVSYIKATNSLKSEAYPTIAELTVQITKEEAVGIQYKYIPGVPEEVNTHAKLSIVGILFTRYEMRPCGVRVESQGKVHDCTLGSVLDEVKKKSIGGIKVISYEEYISELLRPVAKQRELFSSVIFYYINVANCRATGITYEMAEKLYPGMNKIIDWAWNGVEIHRDSEEISKRLERQGHRKLTIPRGAEVRNLGHVLTMDNRMNIIKPKSAVLEYNKELILLGANKLPFMGIKVTTENKGFIWLRKDIELVYIERKESEYAITIE